MYERVQETPTMEPVRTRLVLAARMSLGGSEAMVALSGLMWIRRTVLSSFGFCFGGKGEN